MTFFEGLMLTWIIIDALEFISDLAGGELVCREPDPFDEPYMIQVKDQEPLCEPELWDAGIQDLYCRITTVALRWLCAQNAIHQTNYRSRCLVPALAGAG